MDINKVYNSIKKNFDKPLCELIGNGFDLNDKDSNGDTLLHYAVQLNDVETVKKLLKEGIIYNNKNNIGKTPADITDVSKIKDLLQICKQFFREVKSGNFHGVSNCILKEKFLVNIKEEGAFNSLHWAANYCHEDIIKLLIENGANIIQFTTKGNTPLHIAVSKNSFSITQLLLENVSPSKLFQFVNAQTYKNKNSCLHIATENGCIETVKLLMKYGAIYNIKNNLNNIPFDLCKTKSVKIFLKVTNDVFTYAKNGDFRLIDELNQMEFSEFEAVTNTRNYIHHTLLQVLSSHNYKAIADKLILLLQRNKEELAERQLTLKELQCLQSCAYSCYSAITVHITILKENCDPYTEEIRSCPSKTLEIGSYCLDRAHKLISLCKESRSSLIDDKNILIIETTINKLQFDPDHTTSFHTDNEKFNVFDSKAQGDEFYYKLLHSELKSDVLVFTSILENGIVKPAEKLLSHIKQLIIPFLSSFELMKSVEDNNSLAVLECLRKGANINILNAGGESPLQRAIKYGNINIVNILLEKGADIKMVLSKGNTLLHFTVMLNVSFFSDRDAPFYITKCLLQNGAVYNARNNEGKTPLDVSNCTKIITLLKNIDTCFKHVEDDNIDIFSVLQNMEDDEFKAATQSCDSNGCTLLQTVLLTKHKKIETELLNLLKWQNVTGH